MKMLLKIILTFLTILIASIQLTKAQIIYTDVNPDVSNINWHLDVNGDNSNDIYFIYQKQDLGPCSQIWIHKYKNFVKAQGYGSFKFGSLNSNPASLSANTIINNNFTWTQNLDTLIFRYVPICNGTQTIIGNWNWTSNNDHYLPIKFVSNNNNYFGWVRITIYQYSIIGVVFTFILKDFAYNSLPNQPILAGETSCSTPTVTLSASGTLSFCAGSSVTFTANTNAYLYQWKKNNINIPGATNSSYTATTSGVYKCRVTNSCGSANSGNKNVNVYCRDEESGEEYLQSDFQLSVSPNPVENNTSISFILDEPEQVSLTIYNVSGQLVHTLLNENVDEGEHEIEWSRATKSLSAGLYLMRFQTANNTETVKLLVQ